MFFCFIAERRVERLEDTARTARFLEVVGGNANSAAQRLDINKVSAIPFFKWLKAFIRSYSITLI